MEAFQSALRWKRFLEARPTPTATQNEHVQQRVSRWCFLGRGRVSRWRCRTPRLRDNPQTRGPM